MPRGGCKQYVADNGLEICWYSSSKSLCFNGPNSENLKLQLDGIKGEIPGEILGDQTLNNEDETTNITDDEHSDVDKDKDLNAVNVEHSVFLRKKSQLQKAEQTIHFPQFGYLQFPCLEKQAHLYP